MLSKGQISMRSGKDEYIIVPQKFIKDSKLKGYSLLLYSLIYQTINNSESDICTFSSPYLMYRLNCSQQNLDKAISVLVENKYILSETSEKDDSIDFKLFIQKISKVSDNSSDRSEETLGDNLSEEERFERDKKSKSFKVMKIWTDIWVRDPELNELLKAWLDLMQANRKFFSLELYKSKLDDLSQKIQNVDDAKIVLKETIDKGYLSFSWSINSLLKYRSNKKTYKDSEGNFHVSNSNIPQIQHPIGINDIGDSYI